MTRKLFPIFIRLTQESRISASNPSGFFLVNPNMIAYVEQDRGDTVIGINGEIFRVKESMQEIVERISEAL